MIDPKTLKIGDTLVYTIRSGPWNSREQWCKVVKITPKGTVTVKYGDIEKQLRPPHTELRAPTQLELDTRAWAKKAPKVDVVKIYSAGFGRSTGEYRVELNLNTEDAQYDTETGITSDVAETIETAIQELIAFRDWYTAKPKRASDE